jgi:hypothetical protein
MMNTALAQLRAKTDRDLVVLIRRELQRSKAEAAESRWMQAADAIKRAEAWLKLTDLTSAERARVERSIASARETIEIPEAACA